MKKVFLAFVTVAAAAFVISSCSKVEEQSEPATGNVKTVTFNAVSTATKTTFGALNGSKFPTIWTANDSAIKIAQNYSSGVAAAVTKISDAKASYSAAISDDGSGSYTFYAVSPASSVVSGVNATYYSWNLQIPTTQTPTASGPDESAMILAATSSTVGTFPATVDLNFTHLTAYVKMSITNLDLEVGDEVASVLVSADANIASRYYYYVGGAKAGTLEESSASDAITILTTSPSDIWFACAPMAAGTKLTIAVTTKNSKVYTKENIITPAALDAGHVASFNVNFAGITPPADKVYNLVTSYSEITAGSKVIIAAVGSTAYAAGIGTTSSTYISAVSQAKADGNSKIINPGATVDVFTIEAGASANTIALNGTKGYLYAKSSSANQMGIQTTNNVDGYWTPTITDFETGAMSIVATGSSNRNYMHFNSDRFSCYASTSSVTGLQALYKLEGSGSGPSLISTYTVTYNGNGNTGGSAPAAVATPGPFTVAAAGTLEKSGYNFNGWNTAADGSGTGYAAGASAVATGNITLYAQWVVAGGGGDYSINFESTSDAYSDWTFTNMTSKQTGSITAHGGTYYGTTGGKSTASIVTKNKVASPNTITFYVSKQSTNTTSSNWYVQVSANGSTWTDALSQSATSMNKGDWVEVTKDLSTYSDVYVRVYYSGSTAVRNIDDLTLTVD